MLEQKKYQVLLANAVSVNDIDIAYSFEGRNNTTDIAFVVQTISNIIDFCSKYLIRLSRRDMKRKINL